MPPSTTLKIKRQREDRISFSYQPHSGEYPSSAGSVAQDHQSPKKAGPKKSGFLNAQMCSTSFTQHFSVHKTPGEKKANKKTPGDMDPQTHHPVIPSLDYIVSLPAPTCIHEKSPPISNACHDPSNESLQHKHGEKYQQSFF